MLFTIQIVPCLTAIVIYEIWGVANDGAYDTITAILRQSESLIIVIATETYVIVEGVNMLSEIWKKKRYEDGRAEERRIWVEWNQRREQAQREGRPFDEPPPSASN